MATNTATFDAAIMRWVSPARARGDIRYYLDGILVEPHKDKGVYLVATNGRCMIVAYDETGTATCPMIINPAAAAVKMRVLPSLETLATVTLRLLPVVPVMLNTSPAT